MKKLSVLFLSLFLTLNIFAVEQIYVGAPKAPPVLPVLRMMETNALGKDYKICMFSFIRINHIIIFFFF